MSQVGVPGSSLRWSLPVGGLLGALWEEWAQGGVQLPGRLHKDLTDPEGRSEDATQPLYPSWTIDQWLTRFP